MANLKRFPNPGSNIDMFIEIFKRIFPIISEKKVFSIYDIELSMIKEHLVSSEGYTGMKAFSKSLREDSSRDPIYNQAKMYAELYRVLGWISSTSEKKLYFSVTELGRIIANNDIENKVMFKECILGIADPNKIIEKKDGLNMRPFKYFLNIINQLDNKICKLELIYGPYRYPDDQMEYALADIRSVRYNLNSILNKITLFGKENNISQTTMENYTRFPIATLDYLNWVEKEKSQELYPKSKNMVIMKLTETGEKDIKNYNSLRDIRMEEFDNSTDEEKKAIIYIGFYNQLNRMTIKYPFDDNLLEKYKKVLFKKYGDYCELLFSPYQMLPNDYANSIIGVTNDFKSKDLPIEKKDLLSSVTNYEKITNDYVTELKFQTIFNEIPDKVKSTEIYKEITNLREEKEEKIISALMKKYGNSNKDVFYPLIGDLFSILGFDCVVSRNGTNYERYDAIIIDEKNSIPIEIKSPGEEINISVKAVRQAIENKIILISRKNFPTCNETSSFVVGYKLPNERAEVMTLIEDIKKTFNFNIGILDFETLLKMAVNKILWNKIQIGNQLFELMGTVSLDE